MPKICFCLCIKWSLVLSSEFWILWISGKTLESQASCLMRRVSAGGCHMRGLSGTPGPHPPEANHVPPPSQSLWQLQMPAQISEYKIEERSIRWGSTEGVRHMVKCADRHLSVLWSCRWTAGCDRSSLSTQAFSELLSAFSGISSLFLMFSFSAFSLPPHPHFTWSFLWVWFSRVKFLILMFQHQES